MFPLQVFFCLFVFFCLSFVSFILLFCLQKFQSSIQLSCTCALPQIWEIHKNNDRQIKIRGVKLCVEVGWHKHRSVPVLGKCRGSGSSQTWIWRTQVNLISCQEQMSSACWDMLRRRNMAGTSRVLWKDVDRFFVLYCFWRGVILLLFCFFHVKDLYRL